MMIATALVLTFGALILTPLWVRGSDVSDRDVAWLAGANMVPDDEADVYRRYLGRHRLHRVAGGAFGALFAIVFGVRWDGSFSIGIGQSNPLGNILFCALAGILIGALSAETFRLNEPPRTSVSASLAPRDEFVRPEHVRHARGLSLFTMVLALIILLAGGGYASAGIAVGGLLIAAVAERARAAINNRQRPLLSDRAQNVDNNIRSFAASSITLLQLSAATLTLGWAIAKDTNGFLGSLRFVIIIGCLVAAVRLLYKARPRPPRKWVTN